MARDDAAQRQQAAEDRRLRDQIRAVAERANAERDDLVDLSSNKLEHELNTLNALQAQIQRPREQAEDADAFCLISQRGLESARLLAAGGKFRTPRALAARIKAAFGVAAPAAEGDGGEGGGRRRANGNDAPVTIDWAPLARFSNSLFRFAPGLSCALGPLDAPRKKATQRREAPRRRETPPPAAAPKIRGGVRVGGGGGHGVDDDADDGPAQETDRRMEAMLAELAAAARRAEKDNARNESGERSNDGCVRAVEAVLDHSSFATTVENLFALSFLIRDGHVAMRDSSRGYLVRAVNRAGKGGGAGAGGGGGAAGAATTMAGATATSPSGRGGAHEQHKQLMQHRQLVLAYSTHDYEEWKRAVDPGSCLMPKHQASLAGGASGGGGGGGGGGGAAPSPSPRAGAAPTAPTHAAAVALAAGDGGSNGGGSGGGGGRASRENQTQSQGGRRRRRSPPPPAARANKRSKR